ncbi:ABC transporter permease [Intestinibacillus sp. Marseille-P6563]|uniref:ABC transporter permease n=1 Tax=Intestinibacillus sp. Marseille-P6563 TaxID=2364792 RepID=UPI0013E0A99C|nr:ABC transporter permease [Intestinibacillus sp. Marseille-P6563]
MNGKNFRTFLERNTVVPILVVILVLAAIFVPDFLTVRNLLNVLNQNAIKGIMAIGMTFVIINGYFDMSLCTLISLTAALSCGLQSSLGLVPAILISLLVGIVVGAINGFLVAKAGINAFVVTLALMLGCRSLSYLYSQEQSILATDPVFIEIGLGRIGNLTYISILFIVMLCLAHYVLRYTSHGRNTYATGGNANAAFNAGINVTRTTFINFVICGFTGALGGVLYAAQSGASSPPLGWPDMHMLVIAAVVLGGSKLTGGFGNIWYTCGGVLILGIVSNVMNLLNVQTYVSTLVTGLIMIGVLYLDKVLTDRRKKASLTNA